MLDQMRIGRLTEESIEVFRGLSRPLENIKGEDVEVQATELYVEPTQAHFTYLILIASLRAKRSKTPTMRA